MSSAKRIIAASEQPSTKRIHWATAAKNKRLLELDMLHEQLWMCDAIDHVSAVDRKIEIAREALRSEEILDENAWVSHQVALQSANLIFNDEEEEKDLPSPDRTVRYHAYQLDYFLKKHACSEHTKYAATHTCLRGTHGGVFLINQEDRPRLYELLSCSVASDVPFYLNEKPTDVHKFFLDIEDGRKNINFTDSVIRSHIIPKVHQIMEEIFVVDNAEKYGEYVVCRNDKFSQHKLHIIFQNIFVTKKVHSLLLTRIKQSLISRGLGEYIDSQAKVSLRMLGSRKVVREDVVDRIVGNQARNYVDRITIDPVTGEKYVEKVERTRSVIVDEKSLEKGIYLPCHVKASGFFADVARGESVEYVHSITPKTYELYSIFTDQEATPLKTSTYFYQLTREKCTTDYDDFLDGISNQTVRSNFVQMVRNLPLKWSVNSGTWSVVGRACYEVFGESGLPLFIEFSKRSTKHSGECETACENKFKQFDRDDSIVELSSDDEDDDEDSGSIHNLSDFVLDLEDDSDVGESWKFLAKCGANRKLLGYDGSSALEKQYHDYVDDMFTFDSVAHDKKYVDPEDIKSCLSTKKACIIGAGLGSGKTTAIAKYLKETGSSFLWICPRRAHSMSVYNKLHSEGFDCVYYANVESPFIVQSCVIQWESLWRVRPDGCLNDYDVIVVDEIESLYTQAISTQTNADNIDRNLSVFEEYLRNPLTKMVLSDAFLMQRTMDMCELAGVDYETHTYTGNIVKRKVQIYPDEGKWALQLKEALQSGKKLFIFYSSLSQLQNMLSSVSDEVRRKSVVYSSRHGNVSVEKTIDEQWAEPQFVWTTSTITVGCDCQLDSFDDIFVFHSNRSCVLTRDMLQALYRVRRINGIVHCFLNSTYPNRVRRLPVNETQIVMSMMSRMDIVKRSYEEAELFKNSRTTSIENMMFRFNVFANRERAVNTQMFLDYTIFLFEKCAYEVDYVLETKPLEETNGFVCPSYDSIADFTVSELSSGILKSKDRSGDLGYRVMKHNFKEMFDVVNMPIEVRDMCWPECVKMSTWYRALKSDRIMYTTGKLDSLADKSAHMVNSQERLMKYQMHRRIIEYFSQDRTEHQLQTFVEENSEMLTALGCNLNTQASKSKKNKYRTIVESFLNKVSMDVLASRETRTQKGSLRTRQYVFSIARDGNDDFLPYLRHASAPPHAKKVFPESPTQSKHKKAVDLHHLVTHANLHEIFQ